MSTAPLYRAPQSDIRVTGLAGLAGRFAGRAALRAACKAVQPELLEPAMQAEVLVPGAEVASVKADLTRRWRPLTGRAPLAESVAGVAHRPIGLWRAS